MDPVCHTLVGAALAEAGLKKKTALAMPTLLIGANLPDIDIVSLLWGPETALWFRRGWTHGILAMVLLPLVLAGLIILWNRAFRRGRSVSARVFVPSQILLLSFVAVATHPMLDFLNVYGMRWLMPFSERWTYGDTLFIVDPWIWAMLGVGVFAARRMERSGGKRPARRSPARTALLATAAYITIMGASNWLGRGVVGRSAAEEGLTPTRIMVAPVPVNPFRRWVVIEAGDHYRVGTLRWLPRPSLELFDVRLARFPSNPAASAATRGPLPRKFLTWARFPYDVLEERRDEYVVHIGDARYTVDPLAGWGAITVKFAKRPDSSR